MLTGVWKCLSCLGQQRNDLDLDLLIEKANDEGHQTCELPVFIDPRILVVSSQIPMCTKGYEVELFMGWVTCALSVHLNSLTADFLTALRLMVT